MDNLTFTVTGNGINQTVKTNSKGEIQIDNLMPGVYTVTEMDYDKYEPQESRRVTVVSGQVSTVNFNNKLKRGDLQIVKSSEDNLNEGVTFHLYGTSLSGIAVDEYAVTDATGVVTFEDVLISGSTPYTVEEVDTAVRYVVPEAQSAPINWNEVTNRSFLNILKKFSVTVTKSDAETGTAQGDASLAGAVYGIYKGETLVDTYTTDKNGQFVTKEYICDNDWTVREITPSEGYLLDATVHKIGAEPQLYTVEHNQTANDVTEQVAKGNIAIIKHTDNGDTQIETPENSAEFAVHLKAAGSYDSAKASERDYLTCDENGFAQTKDMPYGIYTVHQVSGWEGSELMPDFDVFISQNGATYRYLINNAPFNSFIKIVKQDAETGKTIPYAGAGFKIYDPDGNPVTMTFTYPTPTTIDVFYTNAEGSLVTPEKLSFGKGYSIVEVQAPYGYVLDETPVYFDVTEDNSTEESGVTVVKVDKPNMAQKGTITVEKIGEVFFGVSVIGGVDESGNELPTIYQPQYEKRGLPGAVYEIVAAEDIVTPDGTARNHKGEVVDTVTTDETGTAVSRELYLGKYEVREITAPHGMVLNPEPHCVELVYAGQNVAVTETATSFENERQKVEISLVKSIEQNERFGIGTNGEMKNICSGNAESEALNLAVRGGLDNFQVATHSIIDEADTCLVLHLVGLAVGVDHHFIHAGIEDKPLRGFGFLDEVATVEQVVHTVFALFLFGQCAEQFITVVQLAVCVTVLIDLKGRSGQLIIGIFGIHLGQMDVSTDICVDDLDLHDLTVCTNRHGIDGIVQHKAGGLFDFTDIPSAVRNILKRKTAIFSRSGSQQSVFLCKLAVIRAEQSNQRTAEGIAVFIDLLTGNRTVDKIIFDCLAVIGGNLYNCRILIGIPKGNGILGIGELVVTVGSKLLHIVASKRKLGLNLCRSVLIQRDDLNKTICGNGSAAGRYDFLGGEQPKGNGYDIILETNDKGEIFIDGLRIGDYTISEVSNSASSMYVLPAEKKATVKLGSTTIVEMHNVLRDTPKTGDTTNLPLLYALAGLSAVGIAVCGVIGFKKKKKEDRN